MGAKYIIEFEDDFFENREGEALARVKGFNSLVFDDYGLRKLTPLDVELKAAHNEAFHLATRLLDARIHDLVEMGLVDSEYAKDPRSGVNRRNLFNDYTYSEIAEAFSKFDKKQDVMAFTSHLIKCGLKAGSMVYHKRSHIEGIFEDMLTDEYVLVRIPSLNDEKQAWHIDNVTFVMNKDKKVKHGQS